jgi:serine/threonine protein kinase
MLIQNKYELIEQIGSGSFSNVYKAKHHLKDTFVAIKFDHDENSKILIQNEINVYLSLLKKDSSNFVNIKSFGIIDKRNYIIMDYISCNLEKYVSNLKESDSPTTPESIFKQLVWVVQKLHDCGYVHRDLKPDNILVRNKEICLIDLGFSTKISDKFYNKKIGSILFSSYNTHLPKYQYRKKDDIISCFYIVCHLFYTKSLPWNKLNTDMKDMDKILYHMKKYTDFGSYYKDKTISMILKEIH